MTIVGTNGLVTVTGGKLTTYRPMAADAVDAVVRQLGVSPRPKSRTESLPIHGREGYDAVLHTPPQQLPVDPPTLEHLAHRYGGNARALLAMVRDDATLGEPLVAGLDYLRAEAVYAARHEMAVTVDDVLSRRTRALLLDRAAAVDAAPATAALLAAELGWDEARVAAEVEAFAAIAAREADAQVGA